VSGFAASLGQAAAVLAVAAAAGWGVAAALVPRGRAARPERFAWGLAAGLAVVALSVPFAFALRLPPGWLPFLLVSALAVLPARLLAARETVADPTQRPPDAAGAVFTAVLVAGLLAYALRALTEPMWANDYLAIWGFKGKTFFTEGAVPQRLFQWPSLSFSHPEYPLGLPFLYAGIAYLAGRWDDHAMTLLFPVLQAGTLLLLFGWLRRRGAGRALALGATALLSLFEPLYRGFTTGMAEVPISFALVLLGTSLCDRIDRTDRSASRRLVLASVLCAATKNEGLFFVAAGLIVAAISAFSRRGVFARAAAFLALPAALVAAAHRLLRGSLPLSDFDFSWLRRPAELFPRIGESVAAVLENVTPLGWVGLAALALMIAAGRPSPPGTRLIALAACGVAAYLFLPALAVRGPAWLVQTAFFRTTAALAPLLAAGVTARLIPLWPSSESSESGAGRAASARSPGAPRPSTRAS
jgi:hypothetical protein